MGTGTRRIGAALVSLAAVALLAGATATAAGPHAAKLKLGADLGSPEGVIAYAKSRLLLLGGYDEERITRIGVDGSVDPSFGDGGHVDIGFAGVTVAPEGKILVASADHAPGHPDNSDGQVTRLLPNGQPDPSFAGDGSVLIDFGGRYDGAESTAIAADGDILVGGNKTNFSNRGSDATPAFARLHPDGSLVRSFGDDGVRVVKNLYETGVYDIAPTPDGGVVGIGENIGAELWKLTAAGSLDPSFGKGGKLEVPGFGKRKVGGGHSEAEMLSQLEVLPSGKILIAGGDWPSDASPYSRAVVLRLRPDGKRDNSFGRRGWAAGVILGSTYPQGMTILPGGVVVLAADSQDRHDRRSDVGAIAFGPDGRLEPRFGRKGRIRVNLRGWDLVGEESVVTTLGGRAVIVGSQGNGKGSWLVSCPPLAGR